MSLAVSLVLQGANWVILASTVGSKEGTTRAFSSRGIRVYGPSIIHGALYEGMFAVRDGKVDSEINVALLGPDLPRTPVMSIALEHATANCTEMHAQKQHRSCLEACADDG